MFDLNTYLAEKQRLVNAALKDLLPNEPMPLSAAMQYSVMAGGKRLRPILCLAAAEAVGLVTRHVTDAACALEMIHTYSLIHDDLPAMDNDDLRRGQPTCHKAFDDATAILAGDALLTLAFEILSNARDEISHKDAANRLWVTHAIAKAAGARGMIAGQMMDIGSEGAALDVNALKEIHLAKTGALIQASLYAGGLLGRGKPEEIEALKTYGTHIGLAFQVVDDILNVEGDPLVMGKATGTDKTLNKSTYPSVMGLEKSKTFARALVQNALAALDIFDERSDPLRAIAVYVIERRH